MIATAVPHSASAAYPRAVALADEIRLNAVRLLGGQLGFLTEHRPATFWPEAERLLALTETMGVRPLEVLLEYTLAYLKEQARYLATGSYSHTDFEHVRREVYDNPEVMERFYLGGLLLTHAFWPIHFDIHTFFRQAFVPRVATDGQGSEIGFGHGLYLLDMLTARPGTRAIGLDISACARRFAGQLLQAGGVAAGRYELGPGDAREALPLEAASCDWLICAEVLEHIPAPGELLGELRRCLRPGAPVFLTTVVDSNALDHLYRFASVGEIREVVHAAGLAIVAEQVFRVRDYDAAARDPTVDVALVCLPREARA